MATTNPIVVAPVVPTIVPPNPTIDTIVPSNPTIDPTIVPSNPTIDPPSDSTIDPPSNPIVPLIDIFDTRTYLDDYISLSRDYRGLELLLRFGLWIRYKYAYIVLEEDRRQLDSDREQAPNRKEYLDNLLNVFEFEGVVEAWYQHYNPDYLTPERKEYLFDKYAQHPNYLLNQLYRRYVDPQWNIKTTLWFGEGEFGDRVQQSEEVLQPLQTLRVRSSRSPQPTQAPLAPQPTQAPLAPQPTQAPLAPLAYRSFTVEQLRAELKRLGKYQGCSRMKKVELIDRLLQ